MASEDYKESEMSKIVKRLMDEEGFEFGEAVREAMEQTKNFESKADGGSIGIEVLFKEKMANGGRVPAFSGGFLKLLLEGAQKGKQGIMELIETGKGKFDDFVETQANKKMFRSVDDIPPTSISQATGPMTIEALEAVDDSIVKKLLNTQKLGLYEETPEILKAANLLERFTKKVKGKRVIDYERAESILGVPLKGDETINDLFRIEFETRPAEALADGGRVGLFMGGDPLTGQALQIYNSMKGYNFSDQEIADALSARGLYTASGSGGGGGGNEQVTGIIGAQLNRGDNNVTTFAPGTLQKQYQANLNNPINNYLYEMGAKYKASDFGKKVGNIGTMAMGALTGIPGLGFLLDKIGQPGFNRGNIREMNTPKTLDATKFSDTSGINTDFGGATVDDLGRIVQTGDYLTAENIMSGYNTGFDLTGTAFDRIDKITSKGPLSDYNRRKVKALKDFAAASAKSRKDALQAEIERAQRIKDEAARAAAVERARVKSISEGYGGADDSPGATGPTAAGAGMGVGGGYASDYGFLKDGGLATMFTRRR